MVANYALKTESVELTGHPITIHAGSTRDSITDAIQARTVTAGDYGQMCDAIERGYQGLPPLDTDDPFLHTSAEARRAAMAILDILGLDIEDPREISR